MKNFSVAIPTYNSSEFLEQCLKGFKNSRYLNEVIIGDDSSDIKELNSIRNIVNEANNKYRFDVSLVENDENIGAFKNKLKLINLVKNDWVYQIDSDNIPFPNIDNVISKIIINHNSKLNIYYPSVLVQFWKYFRVAKFFSRFNSKYRVRFSSELLKFDVDKTQKAIVEFLEYDTSNDKTIGSPELDSKFLIDKHIYWVLNCGNFIVNKNQFLDIMTDGIKFSREILSMDAVAFSYLWLKNQGSIILHPDLGHFHRKRLSSVSYVEKDASKISRQFFTDEIMSLISND